MASASGILPQELAEIEELAFMESALERDMVIYDASFTKAGRAIGKNVYWRTFLIPADSEAGVLGPEVSESTDMSMLDSTDEHGDPLHDVDIRAFTRL